MDCLFTFGLIKKEYLNETDQTNIRFVYLIRKYNFRYTYTK